MKTIDEKLILHVNGSLDDNEKDAVDALVKQDDELQKEQIFLETLRRGIKDNDRGYDSPGEFGLTRLKRDIQQQTNRTEAKQNKNPLFWKRIAITASVVCSLQLAFNLTQNPIPADINMQTLSSPSSGATLQIMFSGSASADQIRAAILEIDGSIIAGPSALGIYRVELPQNSDPQRALAVLQNLNYIDQAVLP